MSSSWRFHLIGGLFILAGVAWARQGAGDGDAPAGAQVMLQQIGVTQGAVAVREIPPDPDQPDEPNRFDKGLAQDAEALSPGLLGDPYFLSFAGGVHRPPAGEKLDATIALRIVRGHRTGELGDVTYGYVMFQGRITEAKLDRVRALGVQLFQYHPNNAWSAKIPLSQLWALSQLPEVHWVGHAQPQQKIHPLLRRGMETGSLTVAHPEIGPAIPVTINLFESDLNPASVQVALSQPFELDPGSPPRPGDVRFSAWRWVTHGRAQAALERMGVRIDEYVEEIRAYQGHATPATILELVGVDSVAFVEWDGPAAAGHDRMVPQMGQDYNREGTPVRVTTVGVLDSGFAVRGGPMPSGGHVDLGKNTVGWDLWGSGCGVYCDEVTEGYHGSHVLGTIAGTGTQDSALRGMSPYVGNNGGTQRIFLVKGFTSNGFQNMRNAYTDGGGATSPRPSIVSNSWRVWGCVGNMPANFLGSEANARVVDDEVFLRNQLYVFCAGNEGDCNSGCGVTGTLGAEATAKNCLAVGMVRDYSDGTNHPGSLECGSSRGPCGDGRWKPNVVATGCDTSSVNGGTATGYSNKCGCSMATPTTTGVLAGVAERFPEFRTEGAALRAWAQASAVTWQDAEPVGPWGYLLPTHTWHWGLGRVSSIKAHSSGSVPWIGNWGWDNVTGETDFFDIRVQPGATRLVVVLTWNDPQAAPGANPALVKDVDLFVDQEPFAPQGNVGDFWSDSTIQSVEYLIVKNPAPALYRIKVNPFTTTGTVRWGCAVMHIYGNTRPPIGLTTDVASPPAIRPGGTASIPVGVQASSYLVTNAYLDFLDANGLSRTRTSTTLKDGLTLVDRDVSGDITLGDVLTGSPRTITYTFRDFTGTDRIADARWTVRSDNGGTATRTGTIIVDGTAPPAPGIVTSVPLPDVWHPGRDITIEWSQGADNLSGVTGHGLGWSETLPVPVPLTRVLNALPRRVVVNAPQDSDGIYVGLKTVDLAGNWSGGSAEFGPFKIDTVRPALPTNLNSPTHQPFTWSNVRTLQVDWTAATDDRSGLAGYAHRFARSGNFPTHPGLGLTLGSEAVTTSTIVDSSGTGWWMTIIPRDNAGNYSIPYASSGPYWIDYEEPPTPSDLASTSHTPGVWSNTRSVSIQWQQAADPASGVEGHAIGWAESSPVPAPRVRTLDPAPPAATVTAPKDSNGLYLALATVDGAGNWSPGTAELGPLLIDTVEPGPVADLASTSHAPGVWSVNPNLDLQWTAAMDDRSGLDGYAFSLSVGAAEDPGTTRNLENVTTHPEVIGASGVYWFNLRSKDAAGNWQTDFVSAGPYQVDLDAPGNVTLAIDGGAPNTTSLDVTLTLTGDDGHSGLDAMRFQNDGGAWSDWEPFATTRAWNLTSNGGASRTGTRGVLCEVRDLAGNVTPAGQTIYYYVPVVLFGSACAGSLGEPTFQITGIPGTGSTVTFELGNTAATEAYLWLGLSNTTWGGIPLPLDLGLYGIPGCFVNVSLDVPLYAGPPLSIPFPIPDEPLLADLTAYFQWLLVGDPGGPLVVTTRGAQMRIAGR